MNLAIIDVNSEMHRYMFATMKDEGVDRGFVKDPMMLGLFCFLRSIVLFRKKFWPEIFAFCFDFGEPYRTNFYKPYKANRKKDRVLDPYMRERYKATNEQIRKLRTYILNDLGFNNILAEDGFEADDHVGQLCAQLSKDPKDDTAIIVSGDRDLWQLIRKNVSVLNKGQLHTSKWFKQTYGLWPAKYWLNVKALMGDASDNIPGVPLIGEKTALSFLRGELPESKRVAHKNIRSNAELIERNIRLMELPWPGTPKIELNDDQVTGKRWDKVMRELGFKALLHQYV